MPTKKLKISDNIIFEVFNLANFMKERQIMGVEDGLERKKSVKVKKSSENISVLVERIEISKIGILRKYLKSRFNNILYNPRVTNPCVRKSYNSLK